MEKKIKGLSSSSLKIIAIISMFIDHFGVGIYHNMITYSFDQYRMIRIVGRMAFPIYCFLLIEGFFKTHDVRKYILRCIIFAFISEVPFDMTLYGKFFDLKSQNIFFTLGVGLVIVWALQSIHITEWNYNIKIVLEAIVVYLGCYGFIYCKVDYGFFGLLAIVFFYYSKIICLNKKVMCIFGSAIFIYAEVFDYIKDYFYGQQWGRFALTVLIFPITFCVIYFYNGERGLKLKYFFYLVYPVHLFVFGLIRMFVLN